MTQIEELNTPVDRFAQTREEVLANIKQTRDCDDFPTIDCKFGYLLLMFGREVNRCYDNSCTASAWSHWADYGMKGAMRNSLKMVDTAIRKMGQHINR